MYQSQIKDIPLLFRGKVRDVYDLGAELLIVTTDRISAFDVILPDVIPGKGVVLNKLTEFWFKKFSALIPSHLSQRKLTTVIDDEALRTELQPRSQVVKKARPLPFECVIRGYLLGSGFKDYQKTGQVGGVKLPAGLKLAEKLPESIFTPATKAVVGQHDENVAFADVVDQIGNELAMRVRDLSLDLYRRAAAYAFERGIIIADTKFEFGLCQGELFLIDEVLTPDSSRFWDREAYRVGESPQSFDKQIVRDYLQTLSWDKKAPGPKLPQDIVARTARRYQEVLEILWSDF